MSRLLRYLWPEVSLRAAFRVWQRDVTVYKRTYKLNIIPNFFEPVLYLVGMGFGLGAYVATINGYPYLAFIAPGLLATSVMWGAALETTYNVFVKMNFDKTYDGILSTPVNPRDAALGELLWGTTRAMIYGGAFYIVLLFFGFGHHWTSLFIIPVMALGGFMFAGIGLLFTSFIKEIELYNYFFTLFLTPLFLFSGIFFPLDHWSPIFQYVAWCTPLYHLVQVSRGLLLDTWTADLWISVVWILMVVSINFLIVVEKFHRRLYV
ncbi:MAG: ABC transporter permease [Candidatus Marinimicrobia bacterium]|nr:ABC transporter permease [Candidatus Neomarinimicrobiota bacterium]MCF7902852.1 ABC transporter permease [Candidatus Neomarinimicrobiota bacterium]